MEINSSVPRKLRAVKCLEDLDRLAQNYLPRALWEFGSVGVEDNLSREGNRTVFDEIWLHPRILKDVLKRSIQKSLLGKTYDAPFGISPMGASVMFGFV